MPFLLLESDLLLIMLVVLGDFEGGLAGRTVFTDAAEVRDEREERRLLREPEFSAFLEAPRLLSCRPRRLSMRSPLRFLLSDEGVVGTFSMDPSGTSPVDDAP